MNQEFKIKNIIVLFIVFSFIFFIGKKIFSPYTQKNEIMVNKFLKRIKHQQEIAPQRLYVNIWRLAKNEFIDKSMNNQDWYRWRNKYLKYIKTEEDADIAINTMLYSLHDPYTKFLTKQSFLMQKTIMESQITGIGLIFDKYGDDIIISNVLDGSSAKEKNLLPGDKIISINNISVEGLTATEIAMIIEKSDKKNIKIVILRNQKPIKETLTKKNIPIETMEYFITKGNIGIVKLSSIMGEKAISDFKDIIHKTNDTNGLVIDLRNNYGGLLANAILMADYMSDNKKLISIFSKGNLKYELYGDRDSIFKEKPIVILVNSKTASAAEVLAGILRDNLAAIIIGESTYGKNTIQQVVSTENGTGLVITSNKYILPNGEDINKKGIEPDILIEKSEYNKNKDIPLLLAVKIINNIMKI